MQGKATERLLACARRTPPVAAAALSGSRSGGRQPLGCALSASHPPSQSPVIVLQQRSDALCHLGQQVGPKANLGSPCHLPRHGARKLTQNSTGWKAARIMRRMRCAAAAPPAPLLPLVTELLCVPCKPRAEHLYIRFR